MKNEGYLEVRLNLGLDGTFLGGIRDIVHLLHDVVRKLVLHHGEQSRMGPEEGKLVMVLQSCMQRVWHFPNSVGQQSRGRRAPPQPPLKC